MIIKRFIAGAVCPSCNAKDKVQLLKEPHKQTMQCIDCGHSETQINVSPSRGGSDVK